MKSLKAIVLTGIFLFSFTLITVESHAINWRDPIKNTPIDPGTWSKGRDAVRDGVNNTVNQYFRFTLANRCSKSLDVTVEYVHKSGNWKTNYYSFRPREKAYLVRSKNRYIYVSAKSKNGSHTWKRKKIDMGKNFNNFTYALTCTK